MKYNLSRRCKRILRDVFGLETYRPGQKEAVSALLSGRDVMCILPTGAGKSLCWQLPAVVHDGLTVVISPLIALMRDQVRQLEEKGIPAVTLNSLMEPQEREEALNRIRRRDVSIVFVAPERLEQGQFRRLCRELSPWLVVVDEAHCIVQWGERFRAAYGRIGEFLRELPERPVLCALTATADKGMQRAISDSLSMRNAKTILLPVLRNNLIYDVRTTLDSTSEIMRITQQAPCKTVIFCRTRERTERLASLLLSCGAAAESYHAGMEREERNSAQQRFSDGETLIMCATTAFGMGVDLPDIRRIIHDEMPDNLIDYVQQTGRASRDGERAECILMLEPRHLIRRSGMARKANDGRWRNMFRRWLQVKKDRRELRCLLRVLLAEACIPAGISRAFGQGACRCGKCSACTGGPKLPRVPDIGGMKPWQVRAFLLQWQRDALAKKNGCAPDKIIGTSALNRAAKELVFPEDVTVPEQLERLMAYFRSGRMHDSRNSGIL